MNLRKNLDAFIEVLLFVFGTSVALIAPACIVLSALGFEIQVKAFVATLPAMPDWMFKPVMFLAFVILLIPASEMLLCCAVVTLRSMRRPSASSSPSTETTPTADATPSSLDDDWADIAMQLKKENDHA